MLMDHVLPARPHCLSLHFCGNVDVAVQAQHLGSSPLRLDRSTCPAQEERLETGSDSKSVGDRKLPACIACARAVRILQENAGSNKAGDNVQQGGCRTWRLDEVRTELF